MKMIIKISIKSNSDNNNKKKNDHDQIIQYY